jgi:hypothetical protein
VVLYGELPWYSRPSGSVMSEIYYWLGRRFLGEGGVPCRDELGSEEFSAWMLYASLSM